MGGPGEVGRPIWRSEKPTRMSGWGWEAQPEVRKAHPVIRDGLGIPPGCPRGVRRTTQRFRWGRETYSEVWEGSGGQPKGLGGLPGGLRGVGRPSWWARWCRVPIQRAGIGCEAHPVVQEGSRGPP